MNNSMKMTTFLIVAAVCGSLYLLAMGLFKEDKPLYLGISLDDTPSLNNLERLTESKMPTQWVLFPSAWQVDESIFSDTLLAISKKGMAPSLIWKPVQELQIPFEDILKGKLDHHFENAAEQIKKLNVPLVIWFEPYIKAQNKNISGASYKEAYQYIVHFFQKQNVSNVLWGFSISTDRDDQDKISNYYPGNDYINVLGMAEEIDENSHSKISWRGFDTIFESTYRELKQLAPKKPLVVFENRIVSKLNAESKKQWLIQALETCKAWEISVYMVKESEGQKELLMDEKIQKYFTRSPSAIQWLKKLLDNRE